MSSQSNAIFVVLLVINENSTTFVCVHMSVNVHWLISFPVTRKILGGNFLV